MLVLCVVMQYGLVGSTTWNNCVQKLSIKASLLEKAQGTTDKAGPYKGQEEKDKRKCAPCPWRAPAFIS
jgi:hypothetical protein